MKIKKCEKCGKEFKTSPKNEAIRRFCSFECRKSIYTSEMNEKMAQIKKKQYANGLTPWNKGKQMVQAYKDRVSETLKGLTGKNSRNWKGGLNPSWLRKKIIKQNGGSHTFGEWESLKAQYNWTCPSCGKVEPNIRLTEDHITPLSKGGSNNIENIQPLCRSCNAKKHTKIIKFDY